jgi:hypothetical protein
MHTDTRAHAHTSTRTRTHAHTTCPPGCLVRYAWLPFLRLPVPSSVAHPLLPTLACAAFARAPRCSQSTGSAPHARCAAAVLWHPECCRVNDGGATDGVGSPPPHLHRDWAAGYLSDDHAGDRADAARRGPHAARDPARARRCGAAHEGAKLAVARVPAATDSGNPSSAAPYSREQVRRAWC